MQPADQALAQKYLGATLAKVSAMQKNLLAAKTTLERQEKAIYAATSQPTTESTAPVGIAPVKSASILEGDVDMRALDAAIKKLAKGCDCPNLQDSTFLLKKEGT